jgi:putative endonuclease
MPYYVYIMKSSVDGTYYKGFSENYLQRLEEHNAGLSKYTSLKTPWILIYVEEHPDKRTALIREKKLKRCKAEYFEWLVGQPTNILKRAP